MAPPRSWLQRGTPVSLALALGACTIILGDDFEIVPGSPGGGGGDTGSGGSAGSGAADAECGDGTIGAGEGCDDENTDADDGCFNCEVEWTCETPGQILLTPEAGGFRGSLAGSTAGGDDQVSSAGCTGGAEGGAATDRVLAVALPQTLDVFVTVTAEFDALLRVTGEPCDLGTNLACANAVAGPGAEIMHAPAVPAGTHYLLIDGVTDADAGPFSVDVFACQSNRSDLVLKELHIGQSDYVLIENTGDCPVQLEGMRVLFDDRDDLFPGVVDDCLTLLPAYLLQPHASVRVYEDPLPGDIGALDNIEVGCTAGVPFNPQRGGTTYLCDGVCVANSVIDMVSFQGYTTGGTGNPPTPIAGLTFTPIIPSITDGEQNAARWFRNTFVGANPTFTGDDWVKEVRVLHETFDVDLSAWTTIPGQPATIALDTTAAVGATSVTIQQTGGNGISDTLRRAYIGSPRYVSFRTRSTATDTSAGYFEMRDNAIIPLVLGFEPTGYGLERENNIRTETPFAADTWYHVELRNIDWSDRVADLYVDSQLIARRAPFWSNSFQMGELRLYSVTGGSQIWFDEIQMWEP